MKALSVFVFAGAALFAQNAPPPAMPNLPDDTVIAIFEDGTKFTMGDFKAFYAVIPPNAQQGALRDRKGFLQQWELFRKLAAVAEKKKLDQTSPSREALEYNRLFIMSQAAVNEEVTAAVPQPDELHSYYETNKENFKQVKVKAIYITFSKEPASKLVAGKPVLGQEDAKAKAERLLAQIRSGADFVKLVRENSEDADSKQKDGDFATLRPSDNIPDAIKRAVFALKQGEVSEPVEQPNGYYLLRAEEIGYRPESEVRNEVIESWKQEHFRRWMQQMHDSVKVQFTSPEFLNGTATPAAPAK
ncbi:MAG: peptidylprolyl isomerase [Acidobacteriia bacterium]|nr:peptidylprolyl isomerase [Terriglobia bacterium]